MCDFIVCISTCDWLISKFVSKCCLGGLGSFSSTVNITFLCFYLFQCIWCKCPKKKHRVALICDQYPMLYSAQNTKILTSLRDIDTAIFSQLLCFEENTSFNERTSSYWVTCFHALILSRHLYIGYAKRC